MGFFSSIFSAIKSVFTTKKETEVKYPQSNYSNYYPERDYSDIYNRQPSYSYQYDYSSYSSSDYREPVCCRVTPSIPSRPAATLSTPSRSVAPVEAPVTFLQMAQLDEFPMPIDILAIERDENPSPSAKEMIKYMKISFFFNEYNKN